MAILTKKGYGQVEPNHLSAQRTGQIYAQSPADTAIEVLENGAFLKLESATNTVGTLGNGEWMLVYNEVKLYDNAKQGYKDFAVKKSETLGEAITPRLFKTNVGDIFTTNLIDTTVEDTVAAGDIFGVAAGSGSYATVGILTQSATLPADGAMAFEVIKVYTLADGQKAVKLVRIV